MTAIRPALLILVIASTGTLAGCATIRNQPTEGIYKHLSYGSHMSDGSSEVARHFTASGRSSFWFFRLVPANTVNIVSLAEKQIGPNEGVVNLRAKTEFDLIDFLISLVTFNIYSTWHIEVSGDVVKLNSS